MPFLFIQKNRIAKNQGREHERGGNRLMRRKEVLKVSIPGR